MSSATFNTILVTGASRGIGLELVKQLLESNPHRIVYATSRSSSEDLNKLQEKLSAKRLIIEQLDVNSDESIDKLVQKLKDQHVKIDVLVNNAGTAGSGVESINEATRESLSALLETNTFSPLIVAQKFYKNNLINQNGLVANISSILGSISNVSSYSAPYGSYGISKSALNMVTKLQSVSFAEGKVRSLSIHPGWLQTRMGGESAPTKVDVGVAGIVKILDNFKDEQNGTYIQYDGTPLNW